MAAGAIMAARRRSEAESGEPGLARLFSGSISAADLRNRRHFDRIDTGDTVYRSVLVLKAMMISMFKKHSNFFRH